MRRRMQTPADGDTPATVRLVVEDKAVPSKAKEEGTAAIVSWKHCFLLVFPAVILFASAWLLLRHLFPQHRYQHLLDIPLIRKQLEDAPAPVHGDTTYVVFVSNANGKQPYNIAFAQSTESAEAALHNALTKIPLNSARWPWFKIDVVTAVKVIEDYDEISKHNDMPSWWYGLALDWETDWVLLPDQVQAHGLVDWKNRIRWDYVGAFAASRKLTEWPKTVLEDDSTKLEQVQVLHTNSLLIDFPKQETIPLYHGHRIFEHLTHGMLMDAAQQAGEYLTRNVREDGKMVYIYRPQTDTEPDEYGLTRHAGVIYSMALLYKHHAFSSGEDNNDELLQAMTRALKFLLTFVNDCPHPYDGDRKTLKCVYDYGKDKQVTKLGLNSLTVLAIAEYTDATKDTHYFDVAKSIASYIRSCQKPDGSFVQKVGQPDNRLDEDYYVRYYQGEAAFGMARLYNVAKGLSSSRGPPDESWMETAERAATSIVDRDARLEDSDLVVDHWLMLGINEMKSGNKKLIKHCIRIIEVATDRQTQEIGKDEDRDRLGIFGGSASGTATATKTQGMCAVYNLLALKYPEIADTILETTTYATRFQLQVQFRPEKAMYMKDPLRVLGGFHASLNHFDLRNDYTQHNLSALLCMARLLKEQEVAWNQ